MTGLSNISRQTGQRNSDTSLFASETFFLCCAELKPPSIAISFLSTVFGWHQTRDPVIFAPGLGRSLLPSSLIAIELGFIYCIVMYVHNLTYSPSTHFLNCLSSYYIMILFKLSPELSIAPFSLQYCLLYHITVRQFYSCKFYSIYKMTICKFKNEFVWIHLFSIFTLLCICHSNSHWSMFDIRQMF